MIEITEDIKEIKKILFDLSKMYHTMMDRGEETILYMPDLKKYFNVSKTETVMKRLAQYRLDGKLEKHGRRVAIKASELRKADIKRTN